MKTKQDFSLYRVVAVFVVGLFLFALTACSGTPKVLANDTPSSRPNKPADVMQPSDTQQRENVSGMNEKAETLIKGSKSNLERHGNYQGSDNPLSPKRSISEIGGDIKEKAGEGVKTLQENLQNSAEEAKSATSSAARNAKTAADDVSNKAQKIGNDVRNRTFGDD